MSKNKILTSVLILLLVIILLTIANNMNDGDKALISPSAATPDPTPAYNPPKEIRFDSSTNLKQELESVNPQVLDEDFE